MSESNDIKVTINTTIDKPTPQNLYDLGVMACHNCNSTMQRGTKCKKCGEWCR